MLQGPPNWKSVLLGSNLSFPCDSLPVDRSQLQGTGGGGVGGSDIATEAADLN